MGRLPGADFDEVKGAMLFFRNCDWSGWMRVSDFINKLSNMRALWLPLITISALLYGCTEAPAPIPPGTDTYFYGYIIEGEKFGIKVGDSSAEVEKKINPVFFGDETLTECGHNLLILIGNCDANTMVNCYFVDKIPRYGFIFILFEGDTVAGIAWQFDLFATDF